MAEKQDDFCPEGKDCGCTSRRSFLGKMTKIGVGALVAGAGIFGMDRQAERLFMATKRHPSDFERDSFLRSDPETVGIPELRDAIKRQDGEWIQRNVRLDSNPGQAGAICSGCAWVYSTRTSSSCPTGYSCWKCYCCYSLSNYGCTWGCNNTTCSRVRCGAC